MGQTGGQQQTVIEQGIKPCGIHINRRQAGQILVRGIERGGKTGILVTFLSQKIPPEPAHPLGAEQIAAVTETAVAGGFMVGRETAIQQSGRADLRQAFDRACQHRPQSQIGTC